MGREGTRFGIVPERTDLFAMFLQEECVYVLVVVYFSSGDMQTDTKTLRGWVAPSGYPGLGSCGWRVQEVEVCEIEARIMGVFMHLGWQMEISVSQQDLLAIVNYFLLQIVASRGN
jgi:hypothetical protein